MCLEKLDQITIHAESGYKLFNIKFSRIMGEYYGGPYETDVWIDDPSWPTICLRENSGNKTYPTGFHIYVCDLSELIRVKSIIHTVEKIMQVELKNIVASGLQLVAGYPIPTVVARKIKIKGGAG